jgi:hypothetical protein
LGEELMGITIKSKAGKSNRIIVMYEDCKFEYAKRYIHKYYLSQEDKKMLTPVDLTAILRSSGDDIYAVREGVAPKVVNGCNIFYKDIGLEKRVNRNLALRALTAMANYYKDKHAVLAPEELRAALNLNNWLRQYEKMLLAKHLSIKEEMNNGLRGNDLFLTDYEIDLEIAFYTGNNDSFALNDEADMFDVDSDASLICTIRHRIHHARSNDPDYRGIGDDKDHKNTHESHNPVCQTSHCLLFHELTKQYGLPYNHLSHIGLIWADFKVRYQNAVNIDLSRESMFARQLSVRTNKLED